MDPTANATVHESSDLHIRRAEVGRIGHAGIEAPGGRIGAVIGVIKCLIEVIYAGQELVEQVRRPGAVPDYREIVLAAGHYLEVLLVNRPGVLRGVARTQKRARRKLGIDVVAKHPLVDAALNVIRKRMPGRHARREHVRKLVSLERAKKKQT